MRKITIYDVAKAADCSTATVSLVLHNSSKVKPETRERVLSVMQKMGYTPSYLARSLSMKSTKTLGLVVPDVENPVFSQMIVGVEEYANKHGYNLILGISGLKLEKEDFYLDMLREKRVDGMIIFPTFVEHIVEQLENNNYHQQIPTVFCGTSGKHNTNISYVKCDQRIGSYLAVDHLLRIGRRHIGFIAAVTEKEQADSRLSGYLDALAFHGIESNSNLIRYCSQDYETVFNTTLSLLNDEPVDAIFCLYDYMAPSVMRAIFSTGRKIPDDIAIIGFDNISLSQYMPIPLSTIETHSKKVGEMAAQILLERINDPDLPPKQIILSPELVVRESTQPK